MIAECAFINLYKYYNIFFIKNQMLLKFPKHFLLLGDDANVRARPGTRAKFYKLANKRKNRHVKVILHGGTHKRKFHMR